MFLKQVLSSKKLHNLELDFQLTTLLLSSPWHDFEGSAALKRLAVDGKPFAGQLLESILRMNAATLERLELKNCRLPSRLRDLANLRHLELRPASVIFKPLKRFLERKLFAPFSVSFSNEKDFCN